MIFWKITVYVLKINQKCNIVVQYCALENFHYLRWSFQTSVITYVTTALFRQASYGSAVFLRIKMNGSSLWPLLNFVYDLFWKLKKRNWTQLFRGKDNHFVSGGRTGTLRSECIHKLYIKIWDDSIYILYII